MVTEWTDPKSWTVGEVLPAADLNTYVRDNLLYLHDPPRCALRLTVDETVPTTTDYTLEWDEARWDSHGDMWDAASPEAVTITRDGLYLVVGNFLWDTNTDSRRAAFLEVDQGSGFNRRRGTQVPASAPTEHQLSAATTLESGDTMRIVVRQNSGGDRTLIGPGSGGSRTSLIVVWLTALPGGAV